MKYRITQEGPELFRIQERGYFGGWYTQGDQRVPGGPVPPPELRMCFRTFEECRAALADQVKQETEFPKFFRP